MTHHLNNYQDRNQDILQNRELDKKLLELSSLFEISQNLNSSLNIKSILDTIMLVPMGRMMIGKVVIMFQEEQYRYKVQSIKGLPLNLIDKEIRINDLPQNPFLLNDIREETDWQLFFRQNHIEFILPLISQRKFRGLIGFGQKLTGQPFSVEETNFLSSMANISVQAIENALGFDEISKVNRKLDQKIQELKTLFEIGQELNRLFDTASILKQLSYSLMGQMLINQFFVALQEEEKLEVVYHKGSSFSETACNENVDLFGTLPELISPLALNCDEQPYHELYEKGIRLIVPMTIKGKTKGYIFLGEKLDKSSIAHIQLDFLSTLANMAMISLENARLFQETLEKQRLEEELNLARDIQEGLLPSTMPELNNYDVHGNNMPSKQVGGDHFDIIPLNKDEYIFTIADVSGKGMPASLLMSNLQAGLQILCTEDQPLAKMTYKLNNLIFRNTSIEKYITFFILKLRLSDGAFEFVNAGHNPPYIFTKDKKEITLEDGGIILGMMADMDYETGTGRLEKGQCLTMFTDGVTEAMTAEGEEFEEKRVINFFSENRCDLPAKELNEALFKELENFCQDDPTKTDDVTILTIIRS